MAIGIVNNFILAADQAVSASTTLVVLGANTTGNSFSFSIGASQAVHIRAFIPFSLGATGGYKFQIVTSQVATDFVNAFTVVDPVTPATIVGVQTSSAAFANALAVAGNHFLNLDCSIKNTTTAGTVSIQFACNSAANAITALQGAWMLVSSL